MIPRFRPWLDWEELSALFSRNKGCVEKFEKEFARKFQAVEAVAFPYGRSAQWAFFKTIGLENTEVIMPAYTCSVVAHAVSLSGNVPRFIDIDLADFNMNLDLVEEAINERTRAIIATHTFGYPQDIHRLETIVKDAENKYGHKVWLMQDCCHAFGAEWKGEMVGTSGDVAVYAFNVSKIITSVFGGMLTFQDKGIAEKVRRWRDRNFQTPRWSKTWKRRIYLLAFYFAFHPQLYGITYWLKTKTPLLRSLTDAYHLDDKIHFPPDAHDRMIDTEAAIGLEQLGKYDEIISTRRKMAEMHDRNLERRTDWIFPKIIDGATYSHYVVRVPNRNQVKLEWAQKSIQLGEIIQYSIPNTKPYKAGKDYCPNARLASLQAVNFPLVHLA
jgi:dTDP-4-amino-4,6-dideoxygalactose transaminase